MKVRSRGRAGMSPGAKNKIVYNHVTVEMKKKSKTAHL